MATHNEKSSFTANALAYRRTFTSLPLVKEIFDASHEINPLTEAERKWVESASDLLPYFEARYRTTDRVLDASGITQIVELAAGLSPRGIQRTEHPEVHYFEIDLPEEHLLKQKILDRLIADRTIDPRPNLVLVSGNVVEKATFDQLAAALHREPTAFVCEGLLRYISIADKKRLGGCIRDLLDVLGGFWVTTDLDEWVKTDAKAEARRETMRSVRGIDVRPNLFENLAHAVEFFEEIGFVVKRQVPLFDVLPELSSPRTLGLTKEEVQTSLGCREAFVMETA